MTSLTQKSLSALAKDLLAKAEKATPGPWDVAGRVSADSNYVRSEDEILAMGVKLKNAEYIAACSPGVITELCQEFLRQENLLLEQEKALGEMRARLKESCMCYRPGEPGYPKPPCENCQLLAKWAKPVEG